jgi:hypothetical protein
VNVVSVNGGKVHSMMSGMDEHPYPLCRGGGQNQMVTKFRAVDAPLSCKTCLTYEARRNAAAAKAEGETTMTDRNDVNTDQGKAVIEQVDANIERAASLIADGSDTTEAVAELDTETEALISSLSGKGSIAIKTAKRAAWTAAVATPPEPAPKAEIVKSEVVEGVVAPKTWDQYEGVQELVTMGAEKVADGVKAHLKTSTLAKEVAAIGLDMWLRMPNKAGQPDLLGDTDPAKKASGALLREAGEHFDDNYDTKTALKKLMRSVQDQRSDVRAEWLRSLDEDTPIALERRAIMAKVLEGKPDDEPASEWVANVYGTSTIGQTERKRLEYEAKKALSASESTGAGSDSDSEGEGDGDGAEQSTPDERVKLVAKKIYTDISNASVDDFENASEETKEAIRTELENALEGLRAMIKATI